MFKSFLSKALLVILMGAGMCTVEASAQGFLKKAKAAVSSVTSSSSDATTTAAADTTSNKLNKDDIPVYHCEMVYLKDEAGNDVLNADGTKAYRVYLVNQKGQKITSEAAAAQSKQINKAILTIAGKVGLGAAIGGLSGGKEGVLVGVATGLGMSVSDIMLIVKLKKDINKQKKVLEAYQKSFDEEGKPLDASVDPAKIKDLSIDTKNAVSDTAEKLKGELLTEAPTNESIDALIGAVTKG
uniref:hypothetical protein n=1 Tax=Alloprevotella sp. TaxID=1872471 RepID=UPI004029282F